MFLEVLMLMLTIEVLSAFIQGWAVLQEKLL